MKKALILLFVSTGLLFSCKEEKVDPSASLIGHWKFEHQLLQDGSTSYTNPYSLLEHNYGDAFVLLENKTGYTMWYGGRNDTDGFGWSYNNSRLKITVPYSDGSTRELEYLLTDVEGNTLYIQTPKGYKYFMKKE